MYFENKDELETKAKGMAHKATLEEVQSYLDSLVKDADERLERLGYHFKDESIRKIRDEKIQEFLAGKPVKFYHDLWRLHNINLHYSEDISVDLYSDGTYIISSYGRDD